MPSGKKRPHPPFYGIKKSRISSNPLFHGIAANFFVDKGFFITRCIPCISMQPIKRTKKLPLLPVLAGAMILIPFLLFAGCTGQVPGPVWREPDGP